MRWFNSSWTIETQDAFAMRLNSTLVSQHDQSGDLRPARRHIIRTQLIRGASGLFLSLLYLATAQRLDWSVAIAAAGLCSPLALSLLGRVPIRLRYLEIASLAIFAIVIVFLSIVTGGLASPFLVWLLLVPFEGALARRQSTVLFAGLAAFLALAAVALVHVAGVLPVSHLEVSASFAHGMVLLFAVGQATVQAFAAQKRKEIADAAVAAGEERYRFLTENAMDLITSHAPDGRISSANPGSKYLLGYEPGEMVGEHFLKFVHSIDREKIVVAFESVLQRNEFMSVEARLRRKDDTVVWAELKCRPVKYNSGIHAGFVTVTRDISERKASELQLIDACDLAEEASRSKSRFLANMSHELRTPLNAIIGFSEVMTCEMFGPLGGPRYLEYSRIINESGSHLLELINSILDMSKIEAKRFELSQEFFDLEESVLQALRFVKISAERHNVTLELEISTCALQIFADKRAVTQILVNLLSNGIKFTPKGGRVRIAAKVHEACIEISVSDTGVGISEANMQRIGQPFEQVENELTRTREGTGLGLALVQSFAKLHGGAMPVESKLGHGTVVYVSLPRRESPEKEGRPALCA